MDARLLYKFVLGCMMLPLSLFSTTLDLVISKEEIQERIEEVAKELDTHYQGKEIVLVMVMKGSICLAADLLRALETPTSLEYVRASSYGQGGTTQGALSIAGIDTLDIAAKDVLLIDDIYDTGTTFAAIIKALQEKNPKSLKTLVLLSKKRERSISYVPDYVLFDVEDRFIVGYGLDYKEYYRGLKGIYAFPEE